MIIRGFKFLKQYFSNRLNFKKNSLFYIVEGADWSVKWDGKYISKNLNKFYNLGCVATPIYIGIRNKIIHFGSVNSLISYEGIKKVDPSNKIILTWFHIDPADPRTAFIKELNNKVKLVHTSCFATKEKLIKYGLDEKKIIIVPLGVDLNVFKPFSKEKRLAIKKELGLPANKIIIGSFQKDGKGWKDGLEPKLIKGPDIFCDVIEKLSKKYPIHVLLTGPARGYVKKRLQKIGVTHTHIFLKDYLKIVDFYNTLDLYLITSREEGGPKALLEAMACGIPIVTTKVGMANDIVENGRNAIICDQENIDCLTNGANLLIENNGIRSRIVKNSLDEIKIYSWENISKQYYDKIYKKLL